ncbi:restriction endonuclease subunit S [Methanosarcina mazei]|uniref:Restriction endonuclease subunit S n=1 Tax=Methanosarcina mazei TaxID=2209 RepID=A0A6C0VJ50_METMZ|nr:restriction endonuclease subunit S [Methanosarcina mazei]QIB91198.1 restriction endonuclease subunit S [Methanosarcina mazei]
MSPWPTIELGKVAEIAAGGSAPQDSDDFSNVGTPFVRAGSLKPLTEGAIESSLELLKEEVAKKHRLRLFPAGSVLFAKSGMSATKGLVYRLTLPAYVVNHLAAVISGPNLDSGYLRHCLKVFSPTCLIQDEAYPSIRLSDIASMKIPLPPLEKQKRIAAILDRAEALRAKRRAALSQLDELTQSIFIDMFGDSVSNPMGWKRYPLKHCVNHIQIGPFGSLLHKEDYVFGGIPLINPTHIENGKIVPDLNQSITVQKHAELQLYQLQQGDVIMGRRGEMGRCAIVGSEHNRMLCGTGSLFIRPDESKAIAMYLQAMLSSESMRKHLEGFSLGATLPNLNRGIVGELAISLPPIGLQKEFSHRIESIEKLKATHKSALTEIDELFLSLQYRAFRGEL